MSARLISIIGPVAVGKTTLAEILHETLDARLFREDYEGNPFLAESFQGCEDLALPSQLYFLFMRVKQLTAATFPADGLVVTDYGFCQDRLYAQIQLDRNGFQMYEQISRSIAYLVTPPSVVIHLDASIETLLGRIKARGREFESAYDAEYLGRLRQVHFDVPLPPGCRKISVNCEKVDLLEAGQQKKWIEQIREALP
jgi:deoxyguanosine kinase